MGIYFGNKEVKEIYYVQEVDTLYTPTDDTILCVPFTEKYGVSDIVGTYSTTVQGTPTIVKEDGIDCCYFDGASYVSTVFDAKYISRTYLAWFKPTGNNKLFSTRCTNTEYLSISPTTGGLYLFSYNSSGGADYWGYSSGEFLNKRTLIVITNCYNGNSGQVRLSLRGGTNYSSTIAGIRGQINYFYPTTLGIGASVSTGATITLSPSLTGYVSTFVTEEKSWSDAEIDEYYNRTKGVFGY